MNAKRRKGLGEDPLAGLYETGNTAAPQPQPATSKKTQTRTDKTRFTVLVDADLVRRARAAVLHRAGHPDFETLSTLVGRAVEAELQRLEVERGEPFEDIAEADLRRLPTRRR